MSSHDEKLLDDIGWRLLEELQEDARLSYTELGRRVGLSTPAVMERIHKMEDAGIIMGYRAEVNPEKIGFHVTAFVRVGLEREVVPRSCSRRLRRGGGWNGKWSRRLRKRLAGHNRNVAVGRELV